MGYFVCCLFSKYLGIILVLVIDFWFNSQKTYGMAFIFLKIIVKYSI